jgi:PRTRC genetic system ThiF family protein
VSKRKRFRQHLNRRGGHPQSQHPQKPKAEVLPPPLDLGFLNAVPVETREWQMVQIIVVGAGGIGAYMVQHIGRLMRVLYQSNKGAHLTIIDPDRVEYANIGRQLFCDAEVGHPKAEALLRRYGHAWGLNCSAFVGEFDYSLLLDSEMTVIVGCVDNAQARQKIASTLEHNQGHLPGIWWLDCGNLTDTGRVLLGTATETDELRGCFTREKKCVALPGPGMQSPGLLEPRPEEVGTDMSCAEMAAANLQSLNINSRIASEASDFLARLLITHDLKRFAWEVNLAAGSSKSKYTTPEEIAHLIRQPVSFVTTDAPRSLADAPDLRAEEIAAALGGLELIVDPDLIEQFR